MSRCKCSLFVAVTFAFAGCSGSDSLPVILRDANAFDAEIADTLVGIVDDDSAKAFFDEKATRFKKRMEALRLRFQTWEKFTDEDSKKVKSAVQEILKQAATDKRDLDEAEFAKLKEGSELYRLTREAQVNTRRRNQEGARIQAILNKLAQENGVADLASGFPNLFRLVNPYQEIYGGTPLFGY